MTIEEYFGKDSRPLQDINNSLLEYGDKSLLNYNIIRKIVIVDVKFVGCNCYPWGEGNGGCIDLILTLKTGDEILFENINKANIWTENSTNYVSITTNRVTKTEDIVGIKFESRGLVFNFNRLHVQVATVSGFHTPIIVGKKLNISTNEFKNLNELHTFVDTMEESYFGLNRCVPIFECVPTTPSAPRPSKQAYNIHPQSKNCVIIKWKKPDFDGFLDILRYEVRSDYEKVWINAGLNKDGKKTFIYTINYGEKLYNKPYCDNIKIRAVNARGSGPTLNYTLTSLYD